MSRGSLGFPGASGPELRGQLNVAVYGARGDGITDDTASIQATIDACAASGGGTVFFPPGTYLISSSLSVSRSAVALVGSGANSATATSASDGTFSPATHIKWNGAAGGTMIDVSPVEDAANVKLAQCAVSRLGINGNKTAGIGLHVRSNFRSTFSDLILKDFTDAALLVGGVDTLGELKDPQENVFANLNFLQHTVTPEGTCVRLVPNATGNVAFNTFQNIHATFKDGIFLDVGASDNNLFTMLRANRASGGTGTGVINRAGAGVNDAATDNFFVLVSIDGGFVFEGTEVAASPSTGQVFFYDMSNGAAEPALGTGCLVTTNHSERWSRGLGLVKTVVGDNRGNWINQRNITGSESIRIVNGSSNHVRLTTVNATAEWSVSLNSADGNMRFLRHAGTGRLRLPDTMTELGSNLISIGANDSAGAGFRVLRVPNA